jgi:hypothetical protein
LIKSQKKIIMPSYGETQKPAGVIKPMPGVDNSTKTMGATKSTVVKPAFKIQPQTYKGNAVLNANK